MRTNRRYSQGATFGRRLRSWRDAAFTLIELLLVLVILSVLAAVVVPKFAKRGVQARITAARTQISQFSTALGAFEVDAGRYPTSEETLNVLIVRPGNVTDWQGPYLEGAVPLDPWGNPYEYRCPGQFNTDGYDIRSYGPDGRPNTDDDIDNWSTR